MNGHIDISFTESLFCKSLNFTNKIIADNVRYFKVQKIICNGSKQNKISTF